MGNPRNAMEVQANYRGRAFTSDLSGQEFWLVVDKGFQPMGLVVGNCVYSMGAIRNWLVGVKGNFQGELKEYSQLMYQARELAIARMQFEADQLGADGVIGVDIKEVRFLPLVLVFLLFSLSPGYTFPYRKCFSTTYQAIMP